MANVYQHPPPGFSVVERKDIPPKDRLGGLEVAVPWHDGKPRKGMISYVGRKEILIEIYGSGQISCPARDLLYKSVDIERIKNELAEEKKKAEMKKKKGADYGQR